MEIYENIHNFCIILTCTVYVNPNKRYVCMADPTERLKIYLKSIKQWLDESTFKIVVVDNSGYTFPELNDYFDKHKDRFEIVSFVEKDIEDAVFIEAGALALKLTDHYLYSSKGTSEMFSIYYACQKSRLIDKSKFVIKITGRYFVQELENFLKNVNAGDYSALRQNTEHTCEIVGCHINAISQVFMPAHFVCSNGQYHHHIEDLYKNKLLTKFPQERILVCDVFQIEPTQIGGGDTIKVNL